MEKISKLNDLCKEKVGSLNIQESNLRVRLMELVPSPTLACSSSLVQVLDL